jgi:hypothetical protein
MSSLAVELDKMLNRVDPETATLLAADVREALARAAERAAGAAPTDNLGYPVGYFESTAGCFAGEPLDAPAELPMQTRESW